MSTETGNILITGATAGIGRAAAIGLAQRGYRVFATGRNDQALQRLRREAESDRLQTLRLDVNGGDSIRAAAAEIGARTGGHGVDVLINNAGYGQMGPLLDLTDEQVRAQFETNVFGLLACTRAFAQPMIQRRTGRIVNISSGGGRISFPFAGAYTATKFAVEAMSDSLRMELAPFGVRVILVEPGPIRTNFADTAVSSLSAGAATASPWAAVYRKADSMKEQSNAMAWPAEAVVSAITRAVEARRPAARYTVPGFMGAGLWFLNFVPTTVQDFVMRKSAGL